MTCQYDTCWVPGRIYLMSSESRKIIPPNDVLPLAKFCMVQSIASKLWCGHIKTSFQLMRYTFLKLKESGSSSRILEMSDSLHGTKILKLWWKMFSTEELNHHFWWCNSNDFLSTWLKTVLDNICNELFVCYYWRSQGKWAKWRERRVMKR